MVLVSTRVAQQMYPCMVCGEEWIVPPSHSTTHRRPVLCSNASPMPDVCDCLGGGLEMVPVTAKTMWELVLATEEKEELEIGIAFCTAGTKRMSRCPAPGAACIQKTSECNRIQRLVLGPVVLAKALAWPSRVLEHYCGAGAGHCYCHHDKSTEVWLRCPALRC